MASLGLVSPARRSGNTPRKHSSGSKKHTPVREYYIPASASVQELKQASESTRAHYEADEPLLPSPRRYEASREMPMRHHLHEQLQQKQVSHRVSAARHAQQQTSQTTTRATSVARRIVLRGPETAKSAQVSQFDQQEYLSPETQSRANTQDNTRLQASPSPSMRHARQASTFRYEKTTSPSASSGSETRQQTFRNRVAELSTTHRMDREHLSTSPRQQSHLPTPSTTSTDDVDFILQFARDNQLELGAEVAQSLVRASNRRAAAKSPLIQQHRPQPHEKQDLQQKPSHQSLLQAPDSPAQPSPLQPQPSLTQSMKPPRPPKSSRRLSATPSPIAPVPPTPPPKAEEASLSSRKDDKECPYASVFDDADEEDAEDPLLASTPPAAPESYSRRTSMSSTRPRRTRRDRSFSTSSKHQTKQAHHNTPRTPHSPATPITPQIPPEHTLQPEPRDITPQAQSSSNLVFDESPSEAKTLISQFDDHAKEDYERNRRLSSLLKGLGIQTRAYSPEMQSTPIELEEEETWQPVASSSNLVELYDDALNDEADEGDESVMLTGDSFQTALEEEGTEIWGAGNLAAREQSHRSEASLDSHDEDDDMSHDGSHEEYLQDYEDGQSEHGYGSETDEKSWYDDDSRRARHSLRQSYPGKPKPLPPEFTLEDVRRSIIEQRASLGITDSVLAGILAGDSFCMPDGARMSMEQLAARLSMEKSKRRSSGSFRRARRTTSGHTNSSLPYATRDRYLSVASDADIQMATRGRRSWEQEKFPQYLSENAVEVISEPDGGYAEEDLPPLPSPEPEQQPSSSPRPKATAAEPSWRQSQLSMSEALALRPLPLELPSEDESSKPVENIPQRKRTRSVSAFQRLSSTFTGSANKTKSRKRLPSFLSGFVSSSKNASQETAAKQQATAKATSPQPSELPVESKTSSSLQPPPERKRSSTGPPRLVDIANGVINSPDPKKEKEPVSSITATNSIQSKPTMGQLPGSTESWRSSVPPNLYASLVRTHPKSELRRQEVIYELYRTEESFVNGLKGVVRVFSQPLRTPQGRWIAGVPTPIARLLDWLDDIVYLHSQITSVLADLRHAQGHLVLKLADALLDFLPRLEVHQPYLIRFETVTKSIDDMLLRPDSDFGEFVRMQQALPECGHMPLSSFLLKPVQRLMKYPLFFKQLRDLTPETHPDHEGTQELLETVDTMIRAMEAVKVREEEYEFLKAFASKITGLPTGLQLAKRDRRLLGQGTVHRVELSDNERQGLEYLDEEPENSYTNVTSQPMTRGAPLHSNTRRSIITDSAYGSSPRPQSYFSDAGSLAPSLSTGYSAGSTAWEGGSTFSPPIPASFSSTNSRTTSPSLHASSQVRTLSTISSVRQESLLSPHAHAVAPPSKGQFGSHSRQKSMSPSPSMASTSLRGILKSSSAITMSKASKNIKDHPLHVFVFNDIVLFTTTSSQHGVTVRGLGLKPSKSSLRSHHSSSTLHAQQKEDSTKYRVVDDWGVAKLVGMADLSGKTDHENLYKLDLLPLWTEADEKRPFTLRTAALCTTVYISLPDAASHIAHGMSSHRRTPSTSTMQRDLSGRPIEHAMLIEALDRSYLHSLRDLSFDVLPEESSTRLGIKSIPARKMPRGLAELSKLNISSIPRSPSQQRLSITHTTDATAAPIPRSPVGWHNHSPTSSSFDPSAHRPDDLAEREERLFWSYRFKTIKAELQAEVETSIDDVIQSGLLHCSIQEIEQIVENLNGGENEDLIPARLVHALREVKTNEIRLTKLMKEAKKGVRMIPATSNTSIGLAISYAGNPEEKSYRTSEESQRYTDGSDAEGLEEVEKIDGIAAATRQEEYRYRGRDQFDDEDTENSASEYDSEEQDRLEDEETATEEEDERYLRHQTHYKGNDDGFRDGVAAVRTNRVQLSPQIRQSPRLEQQLPTRVQPSPRSQASPRIMKDAPRIVGAASPRIKDSQRLKDSPRLQQQQHQQLLSSSAMQREAANQSQRYGAYYRPCGTSPALSGNSPRVGAGSASTSSPNAQSQIKLATAATNLTSSPNHLALATQMRRERQASHSSPNLSTRASPALNAQESVSISMSRSMTSPRERERRVRMPSCSPRYEEGARERENVKEKEEITPSPSLETVFTVQRAQRVPLNPRR